uniref:Uncharacterized protein n=1 Tax=Anguilla anguilla TaxID=7936 RepID=A0A0E9QYM7_ANGAN
MPNPAPPPEDEHTTHLLSFYLHFCFFNYDLFFFFISSAKTYKN